MQIGLSTETPMPLFAPRRSTFARSDKGVIDASAAYQVTMASTQAAYDNKIASLQNVPLQLRWVALASCQCFSASAYSRPPTRPTPTTPPQSQGPARERTQTRQRRLIVRTMRLGRLAILEALISLMG